MIFIACYYSNFRSPSLLEVSFANIVAINIGRNLTNLFISVSAIIQNSLRWFRFL